VSIRSASEGPIPADLYALTSARVLVGRAGVSYPTKTLLSLRADHAAARDAVRSRVDLEAPAWRSLRAQGLFEVDSKARTGREHLLEPHRGRRLSEAAARAIVRNCAPDVDVQIVLGDGLSADALTAQAPDLVAQLSTQVEDRGWSTGTTFFVRHCRVGVMNDVGSLLRPRFVALLIGERPGLGSALSMSAYLAFEPAPGDTDADRNLISNIHRQGASIPEAAERIMRLFDAMEESGASGVTVKEPAYPIADSAKLAPTPAGHSLDE
jgi:ethanolamine ammonia-lyase small subunit